MTSPRRVLTALAHQEPDRVPIDYAANPEVSSALKRHFRLPPDDDEALLQALAIDFRHHWPNYTGPQLHPDLPNRQITEWGQRTTWIEHGTGGYWDWCDWPLQSATLEQVESWPLPNPDHYDYQALRARCLQHQGYALVLGSPSVGDIINATSTLRTMEQLLVDLITDDPVGLRLIDRRLEVLLAVADRALAATHDLVHLFMIGEDLGTQIAPLISLDLFTKHIRPRLQPLIDLARSHDLPVMMHSCGSSSWAFDALLDMGVVAIDTLQPEAKDMSPAYLKERYGQRLAFHGMISTTGPVATSSPLDVIQSVQQTLEIMMPQGGYFLSPTHLLQSNTPLPNVLALYQAAHHFGQYR